MMQAAESREGTYRASQCGTERGQSACWRILRKPKMRPIFMVVADILAHEPLQMPFIQYDHMIEQVAAAASHPALRDAVLPGTAIGRAHGFTSHPPDRRNHILAKFGVVIEQQEFVRRRV